jgi:hypothetical protein
MMQVTLFVESALALTTKAVLVVFFVLTVIQVIDSAAIAVRSIMQQ